MKFVVIEGTDGSGKQTQTKLLKEYLVKNGKSVLSQSFPNYQSASSAPVKMYLGGEICKKANELDAYQSSVLFSVDRLCTMEGLKHDKSDFWVFDRYIQSNLIHQGSKISKKRELKKYTNWLLSFEYETLKLPQPDLVIFLNMPPQNSIALAQGRTEQKTGNKKDIHEQDSEHLHNAWKTGMFLAKKLGWKVIDCANPDGTLKSIQAVHAQVIEVISYL